MTTNKDSTNCNTKTTACKLVARRMIKNFFEHNVGQNAAALAYYLLFALFPMLIFVCNLLGLLNLNIYAVTSALQQVLPKDAVGIIETYLAYVSNTSSHVLLWFALVFSVWFPMRAAKGLMDDIRRAYGLGLPQNAILYIFRQLIYTVVLLLVIVLTLLLSLVGERFLTYVNSLIPENDLRMSEYLLGAWQYLRFIPVALLMCVAIGTLYAVSLDERQPVKTVLPGLIAALVSWMVVSLAFSFYVERFANYTVIYGTLGAIIILMIWLYLSAIILILGAELNASLLFVRSERNEQATVEADNKIPVCKE